MNGLIRLEDAIKAINDTPCHSESIRATFRCAISALDNENVLEQIRAEIETLPRELPTDARNMVRRTRVLDIIDRHIKGADK